MVQPTRMKNSVCVFADEAAERRHDNQNRKVEQLLKSVWVFISDLEPLFKAQTNNLVTKL